MWNCFYLHKHYRSISRKLLKFIEVSDLCILWLFLLIKRITRPFHLKFFRLFLLGQDSTTLLFDSRRHFPQTSTLKMNVLQSFLSSSSTSWWSFLKFSLLRKELPNLLFEAQNWVLHFPGSLFSWEWQRFCLYLYRQYTYQLH